VSTVLGERERVYEQLSVLGKSVRKVHFTVYRKALTSHPDHQIKLWRSL
jgi:hypothetical protein